MSDLAKNFQLEKGLFPYLFVNNPNIPLDYIGSVPPFELFTGISIEQYLSYSKEFKSKGWDLRKETIRYCQQDVLLLYKIIEKFERNIYCFMEANLKAISINDVGIDKEDLQELVKLSKQI